MNPPPGILPPGVSFYYAPTGEIFYLHVPSGALYWNCQTLRQHFHVSDYCAPSNKNEMPQEVAVQTEATFTPQTDGALIPPIPPGECMEPKGEEKKPIECKRPELWHTEHCRFKGDCRNMKNYGVCAYAHTRQELEKGRKQWAAKRSTK